MASVYSSQPGPFGKHQALVNISQAQETSFSKSRLINFRQWYTYTSGCKFIDEVMYRLALKNCTLNLGNLVTLMVSSLSIDFPGDIDDGASDGKTYQNVLLAVDTYGGNKKLRSHHKAKLCSSANNSTSTCMYLCN